jgi:hypothetical protein
MLFEWRQPTPVEIAVQARPSASRNINLRSITRAGSFLLSKLIAHLQKLDGRTCRAGINATGENPWHMDGHGPLKRSPLPLPRPSWNESDLQRVSPLVRLGELARGRRMSRIQSRIDVQKIGVFGHVFWNESKLWTYQRRRRSWKRSRAQENDRGEQGACAV